MDDVVFKCGKNDVAEEHKRSCAVADTAGDVIWHKSKSRLRKMPPRIYK
jgi:hypothetical protein